MFEGLGETRVVTFRELLEKSGTSDVKAIGRYVSGFIAEMKPSSIVLHDYGLLFGLMGLFRLKRKGELTFPTRLTLFNGALRGFDVLKTRYVFRLQIMSWANFSQQVEKTGAVLDPGLEKHWGSVKHVYRQIIFGSLVEKAKRILGREKSIKFDLGIPIRLIYSTNDPFVLKEPLDLLQTDLGITDVHRVDYGHFPYSGPVEEIRKHFQDEG
jgi:hypothetical protein